MDSSKYTKSRVVSVSVSKCLAGQLGLKVGPFLSQTCHPAPLEILSENGLSKPFPLGIMLPNTFRLLSNLNLFSKAHYEKWNWIWFGLSIFPFSRTLIQPEVWETLLWLKSLAEQWVKTEMAHSCLSGYWCTSAGSTTLLENHTHLVKKQDRVLGPAWGLAAKRLHFPITWKPSPPNMT